MSVLNMSSPGTLPDADLEQLAQLAVTLSRRLARVLPQEMTGVIGEALAHVDSAISVGGCRLVEFAESGAVTRVHVSTSGATDRAGDRAPDPEAWLVERLTRGEIVDISRPDCSIPGGAGLARRTGGLRAGDRNRPVVAAMAATPDRSTAAPVGDPGGGAAARAP